MPNKIMLYYRSKFLIVFVGVLINIALKRNKRSAYYLLIKFKNYGKEIICRWIIL